MDRHEADQTTTAKGDGIMAALTSVTAARRAAVNAQQSLRDHEQAEPEPLLRVRIGLGAGWQVARGDDLFGAAVKLASRVCDQANAGETLVVGTVRDLAMGKEFTFTPVEELDLKGFPEPIRVCRLEW